ncbi:MAG: hypothetical protein HY204_07360 [Nitrospirae bacterium]|nr:hypothetical protein [Nitrospirota bacterium]
MNTIRRKAKIWPFVVIGVILLGGYIVWDFAQHRRVEEYVTKSPDVPGTGVPGGPDAELAAFHQVKDRFTRKATAGGIRITVIWDTPEFFRTLAVAEGAQGMKRPDAVYHEYEKRFNVYDNLIFTVIMESESVDLRTYAVKEKSLLRNDKEISITPWQWSEARGSSSRHLEGVLSFPQMTAVGEHLIGHLIGEHLPGEKPPTVLELVLKGLPGEQEAVFRWELPQNP